MRTVLHRHTLADGSHHFDWMIEPHIPRDVLPSADDRIAITFRLSEIPRWDEPFTGVRLPPHRMMYLDVSAHVLSGGRGAVERVGSGLIRELIDESGRLIVRGTIGGRHVHVFARPLDRPRLTDEHLWAFEPRPGTDERCVVQRSYTDGMASDSSKLTYAGAGVDIEAGDAFAASIRALMRKTHGPRVIQNDGGFAGLFRLDYNEAIFKRNYRDPVLVACTDGVGTKIKLAEQLDNYASLGTDLVAMNVNDLVVQGAEPLLFLDYIACGKVHQERLHAIVASIADACASCNCALIGGETAEMPDIYEGDALDLAGFSLGVVELSRAQDPSRVEPGDVVIGLESDGVHSNGFTLVRKILDRAQPDLHAPREELDGVSLADALLAPTRVYAGPIAKLMRRYTVKRIITGMAHITGGGLAGNLDRALHPAVDAVLTRERWPVHPIFPLLQSLGDIDDAEMDRVFNMGIGYCLIVRPSFASSVEKQLARLGERPHVIGEITAGSGLVRFG